MMTVLARFIELAQEAVAQGMAPDAITQLPVYRRLARMGEDIPESQLARYKELATELEQAFATRGGANAA
jgi:hypothetical protein